MFDWLDDLDLGEVLETVGEVAGTVAVVVEALTTVIDHFSDKS